MQDAFRALPIRVARSFLVLLQNCSGHVNVEITESLGLRLKGSRRGVVFRVCANQWAE